MFVQVIEAVVLEFGGDKPVSMTCRGVRWRVSDTPTELRETIYLTHPMSRRVGWRFQATSAGGVARVFDVAGDAAGWRLAAVYD
ncbi:hypothetical protein ACFOYW_13355 [Gryllotalpicola reticulitermitis]|uniref:Uncharacterized protein n=1 Tax=Gryllotalpicola reticulitermitis TaxID=1184153 RepID=A0ABV8Q7K3_9MICO